MGLTSSKSNNNNYSNYNNNSNVNKNRRFEHINLRAPIQDKYRSMQEIQDALRDSGLESSNLIIGIDFTKSNTWTGKRSFGGLSLHSLFNDGRMNPYQQVISVIGRTLEPFDDDNLIPAYGFGDITTTDRSIFSFLQNDQPCNGFEEVLRRYNELTPNIRMSGPTNFAPLINKAVEIVKQTGQYHILLIVADGQVDAVKATKTAIENASNYPLSIVNIGVGDGPFDLMEEFDDELGNSKFDNFQFVNFEKTVHGPRVENPDIEFAVAALQEIPDQYMCCKKLGYF